jgi:hypothetical protein
MTHDEDDDTQVYADTLLIVYQRGFADGKKAAERKPLTDEMIKRMKEGEDAYTKRGAFANGWLSAEAAHNIKEQP